MKKLLIIYVFIILAQFRVISQNISNAGFDSLCVCAIDRIWDWVTSDTYYIMNDSVFPFAPDQLFDSSNIDLHMAYNTVNINYDDDSIHYTNSVKIFTRPGLIYPDGKKFRGFIANGNHFYTNTDGFIDFSKGGSPFPFKPISIKGSYKFEDTLSVIDEFAKVIVLLKKFNTITNSIDTVGYAESSTELNPSTLWQNFEIPINYNTNLIPDSIVVVIFSSSIADMPTTLWIDDISFDFTTNSEEIREEKLITIFPNPAYDKVFIMGKNINQYKFKLTDLYGNVLINDFLTDEIDMNSFSPGIYFLSVITDNKTLEFFKIIKINKTSK